MYKQKIFYFRFIYILILIYNFIFSLFFKKILKSLKPTIPDIVSTKKFGTFESNGAYFKNNKVNPDIFTF